jgi:hypothetical protein
MRRARTARTSIEGPPRSPEGDVPVAEREGVFVFQDERLEGAREVEKHLLRMGPRNTRLVQAKARELLDALGLPPPGSAGAVR